MNKTELKQIQAFLQKSFHSSSIKLALSPPEGDAADVYLGERKIARVSVDDEDGDRSFAFEMRLPFERPVLQDYLRKLFETDQLSLAPHGQKKDSVELYSSDQFLGVVSADDSSRKTFTLQIAILDVDLEEYH